MNITLQKDRAGQSEQNAAPAARLIYGIGRSEHITDALISLHWLRVPERILFKIAVMTYRALNGSTVHQSICPSYFTRVTDVTVPSRQRLGFLQPTCCPAVQPFHRRKTGFSSFRRQLLEQSSIRPLHTCLLYTSPSPRD